MPQNVEPQNSASNFQEIDSNAAAVTMVVVDGIVMGPTVSIFSKKVSLINKLKIILALCI